MLRLRSISPKARFRFGQHALDIPFGAGQCLVVGFEAGLQAWRGIFLMIKLSLAQSYLRIAESRLKLLPVLFDDQDYSDVICEAQEIVEPALKGMLRHVGIEPLKWHDVGELLLEHRERFSMEIPEAANRLAAVLKTGTRLFRLTAGAWAVIFTVVFSGELSFKMR